MPGALTPEQADRVVYNTVLVLRARPDLLDEWSAHLERLLREAQAAAREDDALFLAAVLTLLTSPDDTLPTGTPYDAAWYSILVGIKTGYTGPSHDPEEVNVEDLLRAVSEAVLAVMTDSPEEREAVAAELHGVQLAARESGAQDLAAWLEGVRALLADAAPEAIPAAEAEPYRSYWRALVDQLAARLQ